MEAVERRGKILQLLKKKNKPVTGAEIANRFGVSRQVIVQDIAILRAAGQEIIATPQGYMLPKTEKSEHVSMVIACCHNREQIVDELGIVVDLGGKVLDVIVEHPLYGEIRGNLMIASRRDINIFISQLADKQAQPLAILTDGVHLHTIEAPNSEVMKEITSALREAGILVSQED
ncbi:MAG: transcription repressor NadR [Firmicutes bacterium]|nr:transcription repressor NadR [Bacillota bacterium]